MSQKIGNYEIQERLGRGGMAEVYRAYHSNLDRYVAIKILHAFLAEDDEFRARFEKEARNIAKLRHPHIVHVYDFNYDEARDSYYMVMELIEGQTLKDRLFDMAERDEKLSVDETLRIVKEAASALSYAHNRGMIHRDVKPANLMIDQDDRMVLTDFGIAKMLDSKQLTVSGGMIGTPAYMSPEQGLGEPGDERSDLYSLGVIMYQLLVGELPYDAETALGVILMHVNDPVPDVTLFNQDVNPSVKAIVGRAMAKDPEERYQTADELIEDIERLERGEVIAGHPGAIDPGTDPSETDIEFTSIDTSEAGQTEEIVTTTDQPTSKRRGSWLLASLAVLVILVGVGYWFAMTNDILPPLTVFVTSPTPSDIPPTEEPTLTPTRTPDLLATATAVALAQNPTATPTIPPTLTPEPQATNTPTDTPTDTEQPTETSPPSATPDASQTAAFQQTATIEACTFDYAVVEQIPPDGEAGGFFRVNEPYVREITLLNTGTCEWGPNTSLAFVRGEDFDAGPRVFIRESVEVGEQYVVMFDGQAPARGSVEPITGVWQLRTRGQRPIGDPIEVSVMVFDPGS